MEKLFYTLEQLNDTYMKVWEDICNIESPTSFKAGVDAVGKYVADIAQKKGWNAEAFSQPVSGDVICITMNADAKGAPVALSGHIDTVHPVGSFGTPAVKTEGGKIYGPGVCDCKGGVAASLMAMDALERVGFDSRPVMLLLQTDEECGSKLSGKATIKYICERSKDACAFFNMEGHTAGEGCVQRKGIITFKFTVHGKEAHSSNCAKKGASAILEAAHKIIELEKFKDEDGLTCNCGVISGGTVPNTVPKECTFLANVRFATSEQLKLIRKRAQEIAENCVNPNCSCEVSEYGFRVAMEYSEKNIALLDRMNEIYKSAGLPLLSPSKRKGGSDAADVTAYGIPCVDSLGTEGGEIHSPNEYAYTDSLLSSAKRVASVIYKI